MGTDGEKNIDQIDTDNRLTVKNIDQINDLQKKKILSRWFDFIDEKFFFRTDDRYYWSKMKNF